MSNPDHALARFVTLIQTLRLAQEAEGAGRRLVYLFAKPHSHKKAA